MKLYINETLLVLNDQALLHIHPHRQTSPSVPSIFSYHLGMIDHPLSDA